MVIKPSPEDSARHILSVYISRGLSAGHGMLHQNFVKAFSPPELWTKDDLAHGMEFAMSKRCSPGGG